MSMRRLFFDLVLVFSLTSCGTPGPSNKIGAFCENDESCSSGLCYESHCLDPDGDADGDGLKNGIERTLGTSALRADTDSDGIPDPVEVGNYKNPLDFDKDGKIDALESTKEDADSDCVPDQEDPRDDSPAELIAAYCVTKGVCGKGLDAIAVGCMDGKVVCTYGDVEGYEAVEISCDGLDNDCDGKTDEELSRPDGGTCSVLGVCAAAVNLKNVCVAGVWTCDYSGVEGWEPVEKTADVRDNDCDGETDEGLVGGPCFVENAFGKCPGTLAASGDKTVCQARTPAAETCNAVDDDCDGKTDEGLGSLTEGTCSSLGVCAGATVPRHCEAGKWICDYSKIPGYAATELCDNQDNDCDGKTDEDFIGGPCPLVNTWGTCIGVETCKAGVLSCSGQEAVFESCDGLDNDCDGLTDEDAICTKTAAVTGTVVDGNSKLPVSAAMVRVFPVSACETASEPAPGDAAGTFQTGADGKFWVPVKPGNYCMRVVAPGYRPLAVQNFPLEAGIPFPFDPLVVAQSGSTSRFAAICGRVRELVDGKPGAVVASTTVTLYGDSYQTPLGAATSVSSGHYCIGGAPGATTAGVAYVSLLLAAKKTGYFPGKIEGLPNVPDTVLIREIGLRPVPTDPSVCLMTGFEGDQTWTTEPPVSGVGWQLITSGSKIQNQAIGSCVLSPSGEDCTPGSFGCALCAVPGTAGCIDGPGNLPNAYEGKYSYWFGNPMNGSYLSQDKSTCNGLDGGTGMKVSGSLTSPWFSTEWVPSLKLSFFSAWEVESVNSQASGAGYDQMRIEVQVTDSGWIGMGVLNPVDPPGGKAPMPLSSGGLGQAPVWQQYEFDLSPFVGAAMRIRFRFDSGDGHQNGFRGWLVDDVIVRGPGCQEQTVAP